MKANGLKGPAASTGAAPSPWPRLKILAALLALWTIAAGNPLESLELRWLDRLQRWRLAEKRAPAVDRHVVHVDIDTEALQALPDSRAELEAIAGIVSQAAGFGAKVVALDAIFRNTAETAQPLLAAMEQAEARGCAIVFAEALVPNPSGGWEMQRSRFQAADALAGRVELDPDDDGILRRYRLVHDISGTPRPSFALAAYLASREIAWRDVKIDESGGVTWDDPLGQHHKVAAVPLLDFRAGWLGPLPAVFRHYTPAELADLKKDVPNNPRPLQENIVVVAYTAAGIADLGATPFGPVEPRVHVQLTALNGLLQDAWICRVPRIVDAALLAVAVLALGAVPRRLAGVWVLGFGIVIVTLIGAASVLLAWNRGALIGAVWISSACAIGTVMELSRRHGVELVDRLRLRATMAKYFSPAVLERVLANPGLMEAKEVEITVLLSDLRNSTPLAEILGAHGMIELLNQVLAAQIDAALSEQATLEHFLGDQFLAYWGAPEPQADSADRALRAAQALIIGTKTVAEGQRRDVKALFGFGVALHSGRCVIGNRGSAQRLDYGIVGDLINTAARVESLTKFYGVRLLVTREVLDRLATPPPARLIDRVFVVGKTVPLELYEPENPDAPAGFTGRAADYEQAFRKYAEGEFAAARALFEALARAGDAPGEVLAKRCRRFAEEPPKSWSGVYRMEAK